MIFTYACPDKDFYFVDLYFVESKITVEVDKPKLGLDNVTVVFSTEEKFC